MSNNGIDEVADQDWAQRVASLSPTERTRRTEAVDILLGQPEDISDIIETELYILRDRLTA